MAVFNGMFPVLPGKEDTARALARHTLGSRRKHFEAQQAKAGITHETWTLQESAEGSVMLVWFEGDVERALADVGRDDSEFATWFRSQLKSVSGIDLAGPDASPPPEVLLDWHA